MKNLIVIVLLLAGCAGKERTTPTGVETTTPISADTVAEEKPAVPEPTPTNTNAEIDQMYADAKAAYDAKNWKTAYDHLTIVAYRYKNEYQPPKSDQDLKEVTDAMAWCMKKINEPVTPPPPDDGGSIVACDTCPVQKQRPIINKVIK